MLMKMTHPNTRQSFNNHCSKAISLAGKRYVGYKESLEKCSAISSKMHSNKFMPVYIAFRGTSTDGA